MANMSYCRFENTCVDLYDCVCALRDEGIESLSENEKYYAEKMNKLCKEFIKNYEK